MCEFRLRPVNARGQVAGMCEFRLRPVNASGQMSGMCEFCRGQLTLVVKCQVCVSFV